MKKALICLMSCLMLTTVLGGGLLFNKTQASAAVGFTLAPIFSDDMMLQSGKQARVFGTAASGETVTVTVGEEIKTAIAVDGNWCVTLDERAASFTAVTLTAAIGAHTLTVNRVMFGEVWYCSGQSNMDLTIRGFGERINDYRAYNNYSKIRVNKIAFNASNTPVVGAKHKWIVPNSVDDVMDCSGYAVGAALELQKKLNVPVAVVIAAVGGSCIEEWLDAETIKEVGSIAATMGKIDSQFFNGMVHNIIPFAFKGVLWYQGEANCSAPALYRTQFNGFVEMYRKLFRDENLPIILTQLPKFADLDSVKFWPEFRLSQWESTKDKSNVYAVCAIDLGNPKDIHPIDKLPLAIRAVGVMSKVYHGKFEGGISPSVDKIYYNNGEITISFFDAQLLKKQVDGAPIVGFEGSSGGAWTAMTAEIEGAKIKLKADFMPKTIRYGYAAVPVINLYNQINLPVAPFRAIVNKQEFTVNVTCGTNGSADKTTLNVLGGSKVEVNITPDTGYKIDKINLNGREVYFASNKFLSPEINADTTIDISFIQKNSTEVSVAISTGENGSVTPSISTIEQGKTQIFVVAPNEGYAATVMVNGENVTLKNWQFAVTFAADTTINITFNKIKTGCGAIAVGNFPPLFIFGCILLIPMLYVTCTIKKPKTRTK